MGIIFGPVASRRFGRSLGIDLSPDKKQCNYNCLYCELEPSATVEKYSDVVSVNEVVQELESALERYGEVDVVTITANGEPTLYPHLKELIKRIGEIKGSIKTLILSNGSTIFSKDTREALMGIDMVKLSLDCASERCFRHLDRPHKSVDLEKIKKGMLSFALCYEGTLIVEILIVEGINDKESEIVALNDFFMELKPSRIDIGTIDRPPAYNVKAVSYERLRELSMLFDPTLHVNITTRKALMDEQKGSYDKRQIVETISRRPLSEEDIKTLFDEDAIKRLEALISEGAVKTKDNNGVIFYVLG